MQLSRLDVINMRSYVSFRANIAANTTIILGKNGTGKTTLLEAIYILCRGSSFRGRDKDIVRHSETSVDAKVSFTSLPPRKLRLSLSPQGSPIKQFTLDSSSTARLPAKHRLPVVLFEPDELRLLTSSPQRRRDFLDGIIARLSPTYSTVLGRYQRTLLQRNELLKQFETMSHDIWESHMFAWDIKLAELGATIIKARLQFLDHSNQHLSRLYSELAASPHSILTRYIFQGKSLPIENLQQAFLAELERSRQADALKGFTSCGPHRDDFTILLDKHPASETASRGEMRTIMLAFKLLEVELQAHHSGEKPLILLDDVFSELDSERETKLIKALAPYQTIITATDLRDEIKIDATIIELS